MKVCAGAKGREREGSTLNDHSVKPCPVELEFCGFTRRPLRSRMTFKMIPLVHLRTHPREIYKKKRRASVSTWTNTLAESESASRPRSDTKNLSLPTIHKQIQIEVRGKENHMGERRWSSRRRWSICRRVGLRPRSRELSTNLPWGCGSIQGINTSRRCRNTSQTTASDRSQFP